MFTALKKIDIEMGAGMDWVEMICKDVVKTVYTPGSICFTARGTGIARKVIFDKVLAIIFFYRNGISWEKKVFGTK